MRRSIEANEQALNAPLIDAAEADEQWSLHAELIAGVDKRYSICALFPVEPEVAAEAVQYLEQHAPRANAQS